VKNYSRVREGGAYCDYGEDDHGIGAGTYIGVQLCDEVGNLFLRRVEVLSQLYDHLFLDN
jgi:hypothetical protein